MSCFSSFLYFSTIACTVGYFYFRGAFILLKAWVCHSSCQSFTSYFILRMRAVYALSLNNVVQNKTVHRQRGCAAEPAHNFRSFLLFSAKNNQ